MVQGADSYDVQFSANEAFTSEDEIIARTGEELSYRREGLAAGTIAYLRVRSASGSGDDRITSDWSTHVTGMTAAPEPPIPPPPVPTELRVSDRGEAFIEWTWDPVDGVSSYDVQFSTNETFSDDEIIARTVEQVSYRRDGLEEETDAYLRVRSAAGTGEDRVTSDWSTHVSGMTLAAAPPPPEAPATPTGLRVSAETADSITWTWDPVDGVSGYDVQFSTNETFSDDEIIARTVEQVSYRRDGLEEETDAYLRVRSAAGTGEDRVTSDWSTHVSGMTLAAAPPPPEAPATPTGLRVSTETADSITWTWNAVAGAQGYLVQISTDEMFEDMFEGDDRYAVSIGTSYTAADLELDTTLYIRVAAGVLTAATPSLNPEDYLLSAWTTPATGMTAAPPPPPPTSRTSFGAGTWLVGADIEPGRYFTNPDRGCYWERLSGLGGTSDDRITNDFISFDSTQVIVDIDPSDVAFSTNEACGTWDQSPVSPPAAGTIPPGTWLVGQVEAGRYFTNPPDGCYWERLSGLGGTSDDRIANDFISFDSAQVIVDIDPSDVAFSTNEDCGMWDQSPVSPPDAGTIPPGIWLVGRQVEPGVYEVDAGDGCYWERLSGFGGTSDDRIANDFVSDGGRQLVEIARRDVGFSNNADCGTWRSTGRSTLGLPGGTMASETMEANRLLHEAHRERRKPH